MKLGSLFSGSGGFELAGNLNGIEPVWDSEIEPFPMRVTAARFPRCKQLGDVSKIDGAKIEPVDIITFGSPCQDLSVAGKQAGIHDGTRSSLFFQAIRIIEEMKHATADKYPRFAVWENVPGAFSSNKGRDFREVLQALVYAAGEDSYVPMPKGGRWARSGNIVGDGYSIAWRVYDAQFWGVPQRRKRIYLIADFRGECTGEILFKSESVRWDSAESRAEREDTSADAEGGTGRSNPVVYGIEGHVIDRNTAQNGRGWAEGYIHTLNATDRHGVCYSIVQQDSDPKVCVLNDQGGSFMDWNSKKTATLRAQEHGHQPVIAFEPGILKREDGNPGRISNDVSPTLRANAGDNKPAVCFAPDQNHCSGYEKSDKSATLQTKYHYGSGGDAALAVYPVENHPNDSRVNISNDGIVQTLSSRMGTGGGNVPIVLEKQVFALQSFGQYKESETASNLQARDYKDATDLIAEKKNRKYIVRRLTPLECCRLQGFPDWWVDGVDGSDSAIYKMWGNGIALPCAVDVLGRLVKYVEEVNQ